MIRARVRYLRVPCPPLLRRTPLPRIPPGRTSKFLFLFSEKFTEKLLFAVAWLALRKRQNYYTWKIPVVGSGVSVHSPHPALISTPTTRILAWEKRWHLAPPRTTGFPRSDIWETSAESSYCASDWSCRVGNLLQPIRSTTQSSVWNFCARISDVISWGYRWWRREMSSVFSGYHNLYNITAQSNKFKRWLLKKSATKIKYVNFKQFLLPMAWLCKTLSRRKVLGKPNALSSG